MAGRFSGAGAGRQSPVLVLLYLSGAAEREFPVLLIPPPKNNSSARQLKPRGTRQNPGVAPQNPIFALKKRVLR